MYKENLKKLRTELNLSAQKLADSIFILPPYYQSSEAAGISQVAIKSVRLHFFIL